ncbi:MAG: ATP-binding protein [Candidatus Delongbacteria bacterium]|jgi:predicted AAA+ superfamily ATPase|nr:ATP-binding protein [Candidatus Delongbacteria bacterium]
MIKRDIYLSRLLKYIDKPVIKVLTGIRRCGKSSILKLLNSELLKNGTPEGNIVFINHESLEFGFIKNYDDLYNFVKGALKSKKGKKYIILDEVQEVEKWEKAVSSFLSDEIGDIVITGSNAHLLSSELATLLRGRYIEIPIHTLSFSEFLDFRQVKDKQNIDDEFKNYLRYGGFPGIHKMEFEDEMIVNYLNSIINTVILKDIIERNSIRDASLVEQIIKYLTDNCGNISSAKGISDYLKSQNVKVSADTVINYISYLEKAFMFHKVNRYDLKGKKWLEINNKFYSGDIGLRNGLIGYRENDISGVLENLIYLELIRRGYKVGTGVSGSGEVDFIAEKQNEKIYIQVTYLLASESTVKREFGSLEAISDNYKKIVLSLDKFYPEDRNGIQRQYIPDFLLDLDRIKD